MTYGTLNPGFGIFFSRRCAHPVGQVAKIFAEGKMMMMMMMMI